MHLQPQQCSEGLHSTPPTLVEKHCVAHVQETVGQVGNPPPPPSTTFNPPTVEGELQLTQYLGGPIENASYLTRGFVPVPPTNPYGSTSGPPVQVLT